MYGADPEKFTRLNQVGGDPEITSIDLSALTGLTYIHLSDTKISTLDLTNCSALKTLEIQRNEISKLTLPANAEELTMINASNENEDGVVKEGTKNELLATDSVSYTHLDYVIHFRPGTDWGSPHIYVYQCLQLPGDLAQNASKPVGYKFEDNYNFVYFAALEYSFTGKIAFKGWKGYGLSLIHI